jgi:antitoxin CptB
MNAQRIDPTALSRLKWRCRRGLLENDLIIERFFRRYEETMDERMAEGLNALMELSDPDLLDLLLARKEPQGDADNRAVHDLLTLLRTPPADPAHP